MSNVNLSVVDIGIVIAYLVLCLVIGLKKYGKIKTIRDYTLGTKPFSSTLLFATVFATAIGTNSAIGYVEKSYSLGIVLVIAICFEPVRWYLMTKLFSHNLAFFHKHQFLSLSDIMEHWYGKAGRWTTNICSIFLTLGITAVSITAIGYLLSYFLGIPQVYGSLIAILIITLYSAVGGVQAVAMTDLFQFSIFFVALPVAFASGLKAAGGISNVINNLPKTHLSIDSSNIILLISLILYTLLPYTGIPFIQRALIAKDVSQLTRTFNMTGWLMLIFLFGMCLVGLVVYTMNPHLNPNNAFYYLISNYLSPGVIGLVVAGLLSLIMSTQDSFLNTTSSLIARDICKSIWKGLSDKHQLLIARLSCLGISGVSALIAFAKDSILETLWLMDNFWDPLVTIPLLAGLLGVRISARSFTILIISCLVTLLITRSITGIFDTRSFCVGAATSILVLSILNRQKQRLVVVREIKQMFCSIGAINTRFTLSSVYVFSIVMLLNHIASIFVLPFSSGFIISLHMVSATLCILLLFNELWTNKLRRVFLIPMWKLSICLCLPFIQSYMMYVTHYNIVWVINFVLSTILLSLLTSILTFTSLFIAGTAIGYVGFYLLNYPDMHDSFSSELAIFTSFFVLANILICMYNKKYIGKAVYKQVTSVLEEQVSERTKELKEALEVKEEFLSKVSHEIRTPMQGILGISTELDREWDHYSNTERKKYVSIIASSSERLKSYMNNILDFSAYAKNAIELNLEEGVDLVEIAEGVIQDSESLIISLNKPLEIIFDRSKLNAPSIKCDRMRVSQVFYNLINNAIKYSKVGKIIVKLESHKDEVKISVSDEGVGIPKNEKDDIFNPFTESSRTKTKAGGTGLGLSIVREIAYLHGGMVQVKDNHPQGSVFTITLPIKHDKALSSPIAKTRVTKILIVDDEAVCLDALSMMLLGRGYEPYTAQSGPKAIEFLKKHYKEISLVLLDLMMPDMNGLEVLKSLKRNPKLKHIPVIMQSGYTSANNEDMKKAESEFGASKQSITKPYFKEELEAAIAFALNKKAKKVTNNSSDKGKNSADKIITTNEVIA